MQNTAAQTAPASPTLDHSLTAALERNPHAPVLGALRGARFSASIVIPDYGEKLTQRFGYPATAVDPDFHFRHFGLTILFEQPTQISVHDGERQLDEGLRDLIAHFGPLYLSNATMPDSVRVSDQRNVFPSLNFHIDRGGTQGDQYTLFWRDPRDPVQSQPRSSSTLILPNAAAYMQARAEGHDGDEFRPTYNLFQKENPQPLIGELLVELPWRAPKGVGEIGVLDNRTVLHASYYARPDLKGYPISVRYLF